MKVYGEFLQSFVFLPLECLCSSHLLSFMSFSYNAHNIIILCSYVCMSLYIYIFVSIYLSNYSFIYSYNQIMIYMCKHIYICATYTILIICNIDIHHIYALYISSYIHVLRCECIYKSEIYMSIVIPRFQKESLLQIRFDSCVLRWTNRSSKGRLYQAIVGSEKLTAKSS